uniref:MARVEL domain-containing protein n=1 Tax=Angiostrongylus cantonensis TaxID=6313 RepID=A0A158PBT2_ANGCA
AGQSTNVLSCFDTLIVAVFAYKSLIVLENTIHEPHWTTIVSFLFFLCFFVCQLIATTFIILAHKRNLAHYCYPRLVLITGLIVCSATACAITIFYFGGPQTAMNKFIFRMYEYFFERIDDREKAELKSELKLYAGAFLALGMTFCTYSIFELLLTRKFYKSLKGFEPVPQGDPSAPQPAYNPDYIQTPGKVYPNFL